MRKIASLAIGLTAFTAVLVATGTHTVNAQSLPSETKTPAPVMVTVQEGDTLTAIGEAHDTTYVRIFNANDSIANPDVINPGQEVRIPRSDEQLTDRPLPQAAPKVVAPVARQTSYSRPSTTAPAPAVTYAVSPDAAKAFIYSRESGNNPNATNPNGCYGLGQDCNGVVRNQCGADYACQDQYFTGYMARRYGSWEAAQAFWLQHNWW